jgi:hypothetical protein
MSLTPQQQTRMDFLEEWVLSRVDEIMPDGNNANIPLGGIVNELNSAAVYVINNAPLKLLIGAVKQGASAAVVTDPNTSSVIVICPVDYLRMARIRLSGWRIAVHEVGMVNKGRYNQQAFQQLRGSNARPYVAEIPYLGSGSNASKQAIECWPKNSTASIVEFSYLPRIIAADMPADLDDALVWYACRNVFTSMRIFNAAAIAERHAMQALRMPEASQDDREIKQDMAGRAR